MAIPNILLLIFALIGFITVAYIVIKAVMIYRHSKKGLPLGVLKRKPTPEEFVFKPGEKKDAEKNFPI